MADESTPKSLVEIVRKALDEERSPLAELRGWATVKLEGPRSTLIAILRALVLASFLLAMFIYFVFDSGDDLLFFAFPFALTAFEAFLAWRHPTSITRSSELIFLASLLITAVCWICFTLCRVGSNRWPAENFYGIAESLSLAAFCFSGLLLISTWATLLRLVRRTPATPGEQLWSAQLQERPFYATILLFATLWQVIALLAFTLALHDLPAGHGLRKVHEQLQLRGLILRSEANGFSVDANEPLESTVQELLTQPRYRKAASRPYFRIELPFRTQLAPAEAWERVVTLENYFHRVAGNAQQFRLHFVHQSTPGVVLAPRRPDGASATTFETVKVTAIFAVKPNLLDYFSFMASTLVTTGHCDMVPTSHFAKMICLVANFYEVFFTVVFFGAVVSILLQKTPPTNSVTPSPDGHR